MMKLWKKRKCANKTSKNPKNEREKQMKINL